MKVLIAGAGVIGTVYGAQLAAGVFIYAREHERVDVVLITSEPDGRVVKEQSSFLGKLRASCKKAMNCFRWWSPPSTSSRRRVWCC